MTKPELNPGAPPTGPVGFLEIANTVAHATLSRQGLSPDPTEGAGAA